MNINFVLKNMEKKIPDSFINRSGGSGYPSGQFSLISKINQIAIQLKQ